MEEAWNSWFINSNWNDFEDNAICMSRIRSNRLINEEIEKKKKIF